MTPQTWHRIDSLGHDTYSRYAPWTSGSPGLVWDATGRHAYLEPII